MDGQKDKESPMYKREPRSYTYQDIPVGTQVILEGGQWEAQSHPACGDITVVVSLSGIRLSGYLATSDKVYISSHSGAHFIDWEWPCKIIQSTWWCARCKKSFGDDEPHYLCSDCRL